MAEDRRRHSRKRPPKDVKAELRVEGMMGNLAKKVVDWSTTGACLVTEGRLRPGSVLRLELSGSGIKVRSSAVVRWSSTLERDGKRAHVCGLEIPTQPLKGHKKDDPQRRHKRFAVKEVTETVVTADTWLSLFGLNKEFQAGVRDLSHGGIRLSVERKLRKGQRLRLRLAFRVPNSIVQADGVVRWCKRDTLSLKPKWDVGIVFRKVADDMALKRVVAHYLPPKPPP